MSHNVANSKTPAQGEAETLEAKYGLSNYGFRDLRNVYWNLTTEGLLKEIVYRSEGSVSESGQAVVAPGRHTDLATKDRFIVRDGGSEDDVWWGEYNRPFSHRKYNAIYRRALAYALGRDLFVRDCFAGANADHRHPVRIVSECAWQSLFAKNMFIQPDTDDELRDFIPEFTVISLPSFRAMPEVDGTESDTFVLLNLDQNICLIGGTAYAGEIKKAVFSALSYLLPSERTLSLRASANVGPDGSSALFFGQSGSGKTTLAVNSSRRLIGDDELAWSHEGIFSLEGGCYANVSALSETSEPEIHSASYRTGTVLENAGDGQLVNARASFPMSHLENCVPSKAGSHPKHLVLLTCDATGILPPIARLTPDQAAYHFISGYSCNMDSIKSASKIPPEQTFCPCYGGQFLVHHPSRYANMLRDKVLRHGSRCWLVNTGWTGGSFGTGKRIGIEQSRSMINAALTGALDSVSYRVDPVFGFEVPEQCEGLPNEIMRPEKTWQSQEAYNATRSQLANLFVDNFKKYRDRCPQEIAVGDPDLSNLK